MTLNVETINRIIELGAKAEIVAEDAFAQHVAINGKVTAIQKIVSRRRHLFMSRVGFIAYLNSEKSGKEPGAIFVNDQSVYADLNYMGEVPQVANLPLTFAEEYAGLCTIIQGVSQKVLWREMLTRLSGCIDNGLLVQVSNLNIRQESGSNVKIEHLGLEQQKTDKGVRIAVDDQNGKGSLVAELDTKWTWTGRIWEAFEQTFSIELTMEVDISSGPLRFIFHPKRLETVKREARLALVEEIKNQISGERFAVYEGTHSGGSE